MKRGRQRIIDQLRRTLKGVWRYDCYAHEWVRSDGVKVYPRAQLRRCCIDACDHWSTIWYIEWPVYGPVRPGSSTIYVEHTNILTSPLRV